MDQPKPPPDAAPDQPDTPPDRPDTPPGRPAAPLPQGDDSRIVRAGERLRREAARALAREAPPRRGRSGPTPEVFTLPGLADELEPAERASLVEVTDASGRPLLCMPYAAVRRQQLPFRAVSIALYTRQKHLILQKRRDERLEQSGSWDLFTSFVMAGEASDDAARRITAEQALLVGLSMRELARITDRHRLVIYYAADLPAGLHPSHPDQELLSVDEDELYGLFLDVPDLISPALSIALRHHILWGTGGETRPLPARTGAG